MVRYSLFVTMNLGDCKKGRFPVSERAAERVLSLPNYPEMTNDELEYVVKKVKELV